MLNRIQRALWTLVDFLPLVSCAAVSVAAIALVYSGITAGDLRRTLAGTLAAVLAVGLWRTEPAILMLLCALFAALVPAYLFVQCNPFAYLHYEHRLEPDGPERFTRMLWTTSAAFAALSVGFGLAARRETRRRKLEARARTNAG